MSEFLTVSDELITNATGLALLFGISVRRVQQLTQDGKLPTVSRGKYNIVDCNHRWIQIIEDRNNTDEEDAKYDRAKKIAETQIKASKATMSKLAADELKGKMHRSEDVEAMMIDHASAVRNALTSLPGRLAMDVSGCTPAEASDIIRKEVNRILEGLSEYKYDPSKFDEKVRERLKMEAREEEDDSDE